MAIEHCSLCPRQCGILRDEHSGSGRCGMPSTARVARAALHQWEEPVISGSRGSGAVFFSGCSLGCVFCQNHEISGGGKGVECSPEHLSDIFRRLEEQGAHNINLVTGTHFVLAIIEALEIYRPAIPVVWNSGGYETVETVDMIAPYIDIWLPDYKYGLAETAAKYSFAPDYPEVALKAIRRMREHSPENIIKNDIMRHGVIVRHMVLPSNTRSSIAALRKIAETLPDVPVSLMSQYTPVIDDDRFPEMRRRVTAREYDKVCDAAIELGLDGFMQERSAADARFIPEWDGSGV